MAALSFRVPDISWAEIKAFEQAHFSQPATDHFLTHFFRPRHIAEPKRADHKHADHKHADHKHADHKHADHKHADHKHADHKHADQDHAAYSTEEEYFEGEEDDGLGYYEDGVKRTLTDANIAFFRESELRSLRRAQESSDTVKVAPAAPPATPPTADIKTAPAVDIKTNQQDVDEGQLSEEGELSSAPLAAPSKKKKKNKNKNNKNRKGASYRNAAGELIDLRKRTWDVVDKGLTSLDYDEEMNAPPQGHAAKRQRISYDD